MGFQLHRNEELFNMIEHGKIHPEEIVRSGVHLEDISYHLFQPHRYEELFNMIEHDKIHPEKVVTKHVHL